MTFGDINGTIAGLTFFSLFFFVFELPTLNKDGFIEIVLLDILFNYNK
jgi:hypothetical protein